jgi:hypothetical protein
MRTRQTIMLTALISVITVFIAPIANSQNFDFVSSTLWSRPTNLCVDNGRLYITYINGLAIFNLGHVEAPVMIGKCDLPGYAYSVKVQGNYAYVSDEEYGVAIINVSDPTNPHVIATYDNGASYSSCDVQGDYGYFIGDGIETVNISNPGNPVFQGKIETVGPPHCDGDYLYTAGFPGLHVYSINDPAQPSLIGGCAIPGGISLDVSVRGNYAYLAGDSGLVIVNISNKNNPTYLSHRNTGATANRIFIDGNYAYLLTGDLVVCNIQNPSSPTIVETLEMNNCYELGFYGDYIYALDLSRTSMKVIDKGDPTNLILIGNYPIPDPTIRVTGRDNIAYAIAGAGFYVVDISDPHHPETIRNIQTTEESRNGVVKDNTLYIANGSNGIGIYDIEDAANPQLYGYWDQGYDIYDIYLQDNFLYAALSDSLLILDISNPTSPELLSIYDSPGCVYGTYRSGNYLYMSCIADYPNWYLEIADISDPESPHSISTTPLLYQTFDVYVKDNFAIVSVDNEGIEIFDVSNPAAPVEVNHFRVNTCGVKFKAVDNFLYVTSDQGILAYDISNPAHPSQLGWYDTPASWAWGVYITPDNFVLIANYTELTILKSYIGNPGNCSYHVGDINSDQVFNGLDVIFSVSFLKGGNTPSERCECTPGHAWYVQGDVNGSCSFNGIDVTAMVNYFKGGATPIPCPNCPPQE